MIFVVVFFAGCLEVDQQITINPDRSAKVHVRLGFDLSLLRDAQSSAGVDMRQEILGAEDTMRSLAQQCMQTAKGVEAWTDYALQREPEDKIAVTMTAYVRDITEFELNPDDGEIPDMTFTVERDSAGRDRWRMLMHGINDQPETPFAVLGEEELAEVVRERRLQFNEESLESKMLFEAMEITSTLRFPGKVVATSNAQKTSRHEAVVKFLGERYYAMMAKVVSDEALAAQAFSTGADLHAGIALPGSRVNGWLFGEQAPVTITVLPGKRPLFNYEKELARAKKNPPPVEIGDFE